MLSVFFDQPAIFLAWVLAFLVALSFHEFCHALAATLLGDSTPGRMGRLTLNPVAHIDMIGLLAVLFIGFGWGKPVQFNPYNLKWKKWGPTAVAFAGPLSNLFLGTLSAIGLMIAGPRLGCSNLLTGFLFLSLNINIALMVFNLFPLPPLDGSKALLASLSHPKYQSFRTFIEQKGQLILLGVILVDALFGLGIFGRVISFASGIFMYFFPAVCV